MSKKITLIKTAEYRGSNKTLFHLFKSPENWWEEASKYINFASEKDPNIISAFFWQTTLYNYLEHTILAGRTASTVKKILTESALDFISIKRKDDIWNTVYPQLEEQFELLNIRTREEDEYSGRENKTDYGKNKEDTKTNPLLGLSSDKIKGVDWGEVSKTLIKGFYNEGKFSPNVENQNKSGWNVKTTDTKHQRQQQIGRIIQAVLTVDVDFSHLLDKYYEKYAWKYTSMPGDFGIDYSTGSLRFQPSEESFEEDIDPRTGKLIKKIQSDPDLDEISKDQWEAKRKKGEAVELSWDLECWARYKRRLENTIAGKSDAAQEVDRKRIKACERLMEIFSWDIYIPPTAHFDKIMNEIVGFQNFKKELRDRLETMREYRDIGEKQPQIFYCLLGKPGVGKSEISQRLANALNRPICILSMGGATETKPLEGVEPAYKSSNWSDLLETFVEGKSQQVIFLKDLEKELKMYQDLTNKTEFQEQKIEQLEKYIKDMNDEGVAEMKLDLGCKAPIILLDELEKCKDISVMDAAGKVLDAKLNWSHYDKYFEYRINLSNCLIFVTMNWIERAPDFIKDRCKFVDIELLSYNDRKKILEDEAKNYVRRYFPVKTSEGKVNREEQERLKKNNELSTEQKRVHGLIGKKTIKACITESWGIRGGLMNLAKVLDLLLLLKVQKRLWTITSLDDWSWDSDDQPKDSDDYSDKVRKILYYKLPIEGNSLVGLKQKYEGLILTKKVDFDFEAKPDDRNWAKVLYPRNQIKDWEDKEGKNAYDARTDDYYNPDGSRVFGNLGGEESSNDTETLKKEIEELKEKNRKTVEHYRQEIQKQKNLTQTKQQELIESLNEIHSAGLDKERLLKSVEDLETKLTNMGVEYEKLKSEPLKEIQLPTLVINTVPENGVYSLGKDNLEKNSRLISFAEEERPKVKKLIINNCVNIIQLDLKGCINLEKVSLKKSKWDNINNVKECVKLKKVSVKDCEDVSLAFLEGTNVQEVKII